MGNLPFAKKYFLGAIDKLRFLTLEGRSCFISFLVS